MNETSRVAYLLPLRLFTGWVFLTSALSKISAGWLDNPELARTLNGWIREGRPAAAFLPFLRDTVLPHQAFFSKLIVFGELGVGVALLAGFLTRFAAGAGTLLVLAYFLARGDGLSANPTAPFLAILITIALVNPGRTLGVDGALRGKIPRWLS
jgi:thiosulfate dehydrogenase (quinone) large subunit